MKKFSVFAVLAALLVFYPLRAQNKGDMVISGSLGLSGTTTHSSLRYSSSSMDSRESSVAPGAFEFSIMPEFGYFVLDRLEFDVSIGYSLSRSESTGTWQGKNLFTFMHVVTVNPGLVYHLPSCEKFYYTPAFHLNVGGGVQNVQDGGRDGISTTGQGFGVFGFSISALAFEIKPTEHFAISLSAGEFSYGLVTASEKVTSGDESVRSRATVNVVELGLNLGATIGFKYYF